METTFIELKKKERKGRKETSFGRKKDIISAEALCSGKC